MERRIIAGRFGWGTRVNDWQELRENLQAWLGVALAAGVLAVSLWLSLPAPRRRLLPPPRRRAVPWDLPEVYVALCAFFFLPMLFSALLQGGQPGFSRRFLWAAALAGPFTVAAVLLAMRLRSGTRLYQAGLTTHRWRADAVLGYLVWLILTPAVLTVHVLALHYLGKVPHPFERLAQEGLAPVEWGLLVFLAVVQAPLTEELVFRGVLQPWAARSPEAGHAVFVGAVAVALLLSPTPDAAPAIFALATLPGYLLLLRLFPMPERDARAVYSTALLFAAFHAGAWPSPVALFLLGLGLGWLAWRTRSLTGPFVVHALFNAVASAVLLSGKG
jgi:membrane protease YdiL (CAAX protease family)